MNTNNDLNYRLYLHKEEGFIRTSFHSEFEKFNDIKEGNVKKVKANFKNIRTNFYEGKGSLSTNPIRNIRYHMIISTAITARICVEGGMNHDEAYTLSDIYIQKVDMMNTYDEIIDLFEAMHIDFATRMANIKKEKAISVSTRKCLDYIYNHLHEKITISTLADYVQLNDSYLSKLFAQELGTPIHAFIQNTRIETAKNILQHTDFKYIDIALSLGFSSQSAFIAVFKNMVGMTPKEYRTKYYGRELS